MRDLSSDEEHSILRRVAIQVFRVQGNFTHFTPVSNGCSKMSQSNSNIYDMRIHLHKFDAASVGQNIDFNTLETLEINLNF